MTIFHSAAAAAGTAVKIPGSGEEVVGRSSQLLVGNPATPVRPNLLSFKKWLKCAIGMGLERNRPDRQQSQPGQKKGDWTMSGLKFERQLIAAFAALLMTTIAVGAAVAPAQVSASPVEVVTYA